MSEGLDAMYRVLVYLVLILSVGASGSILLLFIWVTSLNNSTNQIITNQQETREILAYDQKTIKDNQVIIKEGIAEILDRLDEKK